jgi:hypothetical protein
MGADFIYAIAPVDIDKDKYVARAKALTFEEAEALFQEDEYFFPGAESEEDDAEFLKMVIERLLMAIEVCYTTSLRELDHLTLKGTRFVLTGGMSWGDPPTDVYDDVCILSNFDYWLENKGETL